MHLNSLTPMRISGTPRSFLNLDSRCPTSIEAVAIGGDPDSPLLTLGGWLVSMNMLSSLSVVARSSSSEAPQLGGELRGLVLNPASCVAALGTGFSVIL